MVHPKKKNEEEHKTVGRVKLPQGKEVLGIVELRHGGNKMQVSCLDGKSRNCRVPGRLKRALWLRPGDVVIVEPWDLDFEKGDILFQYRPIQVEWLKQHGYLNKEEEEF